MTQAFIPGIDLSMMYKEMYWASEDFRSLLEFWKTIYLRKNREKMKDDREDS